MTSYEEIRQSVKDAPSASYWLKAAVEALHQRDPIDAAHDAHVLTEICQARIAECFK